MDGQGGAKINSIRQIVRLREIIHKWHNVKFSARIHSPDNDHGQNSLPRGVSPSLNGRLIKGSATMCDSDEEGSSHSSAPPHDVPKGFLAVYVGKERPRFRRFIIPTSYLSHHLFKLLLEKAEEEYGFDHTGGISIPCEVETFKYLLNCIENENAVKEEQSDDRGDVFYKLFEFSNLIDNNERASTEESSCPRD